MLVACVLSEAVADRFRIPSENRKQPTFLDSSSLADPTPDPTPDLGYKELWRLQNEFYEKWITPNNVKEAESINSSVFSDNVGSTHPPHFQRADSC